MATEKDLELLDEYLTNRMSGADRVEFELKIAADAELRNELQLQQRLIEGIKKARISELKTILNNTVVPPIPHGGSMTLVGKFAAGVVVSGLIATGIYFYVQDSETPAASEEQEEVLAPQITDSTLETADATPAADTAEQPATNESTPETAKANHEVKKADSQKTAAPSKHPVLDVYQPEEETADSETAAVDVEEAAGERTQQIKAGAPSIIAEVDRNNAEYTFHYQFKDGQLYLFGPFERNLYEILEFFSGEKRTVFLFYKEGYYLLDESTDKIKSLKKITDPALLKALQESRQKN